MDAKDVGQVNMLSVKFKKIKPASYMSHMDMQRAVNRVIRRAGMDFKYSKGFNPHAFLKLSAPIPLGLESEAEFVTIDAEGEGLTVDNIIEKFNSVSPAGLVFESVWETEKNPNFAAGIVATDYLISVDLSESYKAKISEDVSRSLIVKYNKDGEDVEKECYNLVYGLISVQNGFIARLATGGNTLRADRFIDAINVKYGLGLTLNNVKKIRTYYQKAGAFVPTEFVLDDMQALKI